MARLNLLKLAHLAFTPRTHEGAPARVISAEMQLRRSVLACMLWEDQFYEDGVEIAGRIAELVPKVEAAQVAALAVEARESMKLRHAPLLLVREMARHKTHRAFVGETLARVTQRADELAEFVAIYWKNGKQPLSGRVKKGLAAAFPKFDEYALAKYDRAGVVRLRDVLFLCHAKPLDEAQAELWKRLIAGALATPDTWEVALSAGADKREAWERLLTERKLGALALLRNLRNMQQVGVKEELVRDAMRGIKTERVLPFRFIAAARYALQWEEDLQHAMFGCVANKQKLKGKTVLLVDVSGSMTAPLSLRSEMLRSVFVCKSMSKSYALSGVRAAYMVGPEAEIAKLGKFLPPWSVSLPAQVAAVAALSSADYYNEQYRRTAELREQLAAGLRDRCGIIAFPSVANCLLCELPAGAPDAADIVRRARKQKVFLRSGEEIHSSLGPRTIRIAVKGSEMNQRVIEVLQTLVLDTAR